MRAALAQERTSEIHVALTTTVIIVSNLLCIHDGHHYTPRAGAARNPYRLSNYVQGSPVGGNGEGSWTDHNAPQWGGLQMDYGFQTHWGDVFYRRWGTADNWPVWAQLLTATQAVRHLHSYHSWPETRLRCGI